MRILRVALVSAIWYKECQGFQSPQLLENIGQQSTWKKAHREVSAPRFPPGDSRCVLDRSSGRLRHFHQRQLKRSRILSMSTVAPEKETINKTRNSTEEKEQAPLSDVDAQVLKSLLEDQPDLAMEDNINRLLKKNELWKQKQAQQGSSDNTNQQQKYSSKVMQSVTEGPDFWNTLRAKAAEVIGQVGVAIANKIERDLNLSMSLGAFFLERAARDTSRALQASAPQKVALRLGAKNVSVASNETRSLRQELNTPRDEIKLVTANIQEILSGNTAKSGNRLRFLAGATENRRERAQRAYTTRKKLLLEREKEALSLKVGRLANDVLIDGTWEMKEELRMQPAGYKTKAFRQSVSQGVTFILTGAASVATAALAASKERRQMQLAGSNTTSTTTSNAGMVNVTVMNDAEQPLMTQEVNETLVLQGMTLEGKKNLELNLQLCLDDPKDTWLVEEVLVNQTVNQTILQEVIMRMVLTRIELKKEQNTTTAPDFEPLQEMKRLSRKIRNLITLAETAVGKEAAQLLLQELVWDVSYIDNKDGIVVYPQFETSQTTGGDSFATTTTESFDTTSNAFFARPPSKIQADVIPKVETEIIKPTEPIKTKFKVKDAELDSPAKDTEFELSRVKEPIKTVLYTQDAEIEIEKAVDPSRTTLYQKANGVKGNDGASVSVGVEVEVISGDIDSLNTVRTAAASVDKKGPKGSQADFDQDGYQVETEEKPFFLVDIALRTLDVVFFVGEKTFTVILPSALQSGQTAMTQYNKAKQNGLGQAGWELLENVQDGARKY